MTTAGPRLEIGPSAIHGRGVFTADEVAPGTLIGVFEGIPVDRDGPHVLWIEGDDGWELLEGIGVLRWLNHSSRPNAEFRGLELYARAAIASGEEITIDYGPDWIGVG